MEFKIYIMSKDECLAISKIAHKSKADSDRELLYYLPDGIFDHQATACIENQGQCFQIVSHPASPKFEGYVIPTYFVDSIQLIESEVSI